MRFKLNDAARKTCETSVGMSCAEMQKTRLVFSGAGKSTSQSKTLVRQIKPRGSIYLQLGRKVSMDEVNKIIKEF